MFSSSKAVGAEPNSVTFTSNGTWVAPAGVTSIAVFGYGSPAVSDTQSTGYFGVISYAVAVSSSTGTNPPYLDWSTVRAGLDAAINAVASNSGTNYLSLQKSWFLVYPDDSWREFIDYTSVWIVGSSYGVRNIGTVGSGNITHAGLVPGVNGYGLEATYRILGSTGSNASAFGTTIPGGTLTGTEPYRTAVTPAGTSFNTTVTPGASYPIVVPSGGSVTIQYYG